MSDLRFTFFLLFNLFVIAISQGFSVKSDLGKCPDTSGIMGICVFDPTRNCLRGRNQCPDGYRCCPFGCGSQCLAVTVNFMHPGSCPSDLTGKLTGRTCNADSGCKAYEKCCSSQCVTVRKSSVLVNPMVVS